MEFELRIFEVEPGMRWQALEQLRDVPTLGRYLSFRDDKTFASFHLAGVPRASEAKVLRRIAPALGSTVKDAAGFAQIANAPVLEIRQYRIKRGERARFAKFFADRALPAQRQYEIDVYGQFDDLDDETNFVWMRGFPDLATRERRKEAFYTSRLWLEEMEAEAFSMIEDYSNSILAMPV